MKVILEIVEEVSIEELQEVPEQDSEVAIRMRMAKGVSILTITTVMEIVNVRAILKDNQEMIMIDPCNKGDQEKKWSKGEMGENIEYITNTNNRIRESNIEGERIMIEKTDSDLKASTEEEVGREVREVDTQ